MDILVGDLAKLYGISSQTLHYYEEKKILSPKRDELTGYRYYDPSDLSRLGSIKKYRNAGFPLDKALTITDQADKWGIVSNYLEQKKSLMEEIHKLQQIIHSLDKDLSLYLRFREIGNQILLEELEGFLRLESKGNKIIYQDQKLRTEAIPWFKNILHTCGSERYFFDALFSSNIK